MKVRKKQEALRTEEEKLFSGILWLNAKALGLVLGLGNMLLKLVG